MTLPVAQPILANLVKAIGHAWEPCACGLAHACPCLVAASIYSKVEAPLKGRVNRIHMTHMPSNTDRPKGWVLANVC